MLCRCLLALAPASANHVPSTLDTYQGLDVPPIVQRQRSSSESTDDRINMAITDVDSNIIRAFTLTKNAITAGTWMTPAGEPGGSLPDPSTKLKVLEASLSSLRKIVDPWERTSVIGIYNTEDRSLRISMTGDSRVVLGRQVRNDSTSVEQRTARSYIYKADILTGEISLPDPSESAVVSAAEPIITYREGIQLGDFVVFASKGIWGCLTGEEVVGLVGIWLDARGVKERIRLWVKTRD